MHGKVLASLSKLKDNKIAKLLYTFQCMIGFLPSFIVNKLPFVLCTAVAPSGLYVFVYRLHCFMHYSVNCFLAAIKHAGWTETLIRQGQTDNEFYQSETGLVLI